MKRHISKRVKITKTLTRDVNASRKLKPRERKRPRSIRLGNPIRPSPFVCGVADRALCSTGFEGLRIRKTDKLEMGIRLTASSTKLRKSIKAEAAQSPTTGLTNPARVSDSPSSEAR